MYTRLQLQRQHQDKKEQSENTAQQQRALHHVRVLSNQHIKTMTHLV